jgi:FKBP-type peptidyl-prolyl cis-trans isomerase (trigger factor)
MAINTMRLRKIDANTKELDSTQKSLVDLVYAQVFKKRNKQIRKKIKRRRQICGFRTGMLPP